MTFSWRRLGIGLGGIAILALLVYAFLPTPVEVEMAPVTRGSLLVTVEREGKTRVRERYVVSAPLNGRLLRIDLHPGDPVREGDTVVAVIEPVDPALLDARTRAEAEARVGAAEEAVKAADTLLVQARKELDRARKARIGGAISAEELDRAEHKERAAAFAGKIAKFELEQAKAAFRRVQPRSPGEADNSRLTIASPITGCVLDVFQESSRVVTAGQELLKVGDTDDLECVIDLLSADAVKARPGAKVFLEHWGGEAPLLGRVRRVEPGGFTKVSALGVEEQRVNVLVDFVEPREKWQRLGDSYRVVARIVVWEGEDVLKAPAGAFFRHGDAWAVFRAVGGTARLTPVRIGQTNGVETEVLEGLGEDGVVIVHPSDRVRAGVGVAPRR